MSVEPEEQMRVQKLRRNLIMQRHADPKFRRKLSALGYHEHHEQVGAIARGEITMDDVGQLVIVRPGARAFASPATPMQVESPEAMTFAQAAEVLGVRLVRTIPRYASEGVLAFGSQPGTITAESVTRYAGGRAERKRARIAKTEQTKRDNLAAYLAQSDDRLMTTADAAARLGLAENTVRILGAEGVLVRGERQGTVTRESVEAYTPRARGKDKAVAQTRESQPVYPVPTDRFGRDRSASVREIARAFVAEDVTSPDAQARETPVAAIAPPPAPREDMEARDILFAFVEAFSGTTAEATTGGELRVVTPPHKSAELFSVWARAVFTSSSRSPAIAVSRDSRQSAQYEALSSCSCQNALNRSPSSSVRPVILIVPPLPSRTWIVLGITRPLPSPRHPSWARA